MIALKTPTIVPSASRMALSAVPIDDQLLIFGVVGPAGLHDFAQMFLARRPQLWAHFARRSAERPWVLLGAQQRNVGVVVEHEKVRAPADLNREFRVQAEIHEQSEQRWP